ncbi:MAG: oligopeptide ABC transporter ATP-binding protein [Spirochaetes bacterium]|nr:MAG: oligopeptide ABC transporter ATP-binding protein [Spirochaetota bacterium]RKY03309.1 MAG: oligopeptide ABC transporter ATP-binding protein [Spirochaetota bacterium]
MVRAEGIYKYFYGKKKGYTVKACDNVTIHIPPGKTLGLVGESGCGKTTLGRIILGLIKPDRGEVFFENTKITSFREKELRPMRKNFQMIFQDSRSAFNPRMRVYDALKEAAVLHLDMKVRIIKEYINQLIDRVNLHRGLLYNYIGNLSGGEVKRLDILRAIMISPKFIIADEPLSPLDISMQSQIVNLLMEIQQKKKITMMFISHDLRMVRIISHRVAVMYLGKIVEVASKTVIGENPLHPYTKFLWKPKSTDIVLKFPDKGCVYKRSCELFQKRGFPSVCLEKEPEMREVEKGHWVACHFIK